jgi:hypothetical protein
MVTLPKFSNKHGWKRKETRMIETESADVLIENHGSVMLFRLLTDRAREFVRADVETEPWMFLGNSLAVEPQFAFLLAQGMQEQGLKIGEEQ